MNADGPFSLVCARAIMNSYYVSLWAWSKFNRQSLRNHMLLRYRVPSPKKTKTEVERENEEWEAWPMSWHCRDIRDRPTCRIDAQRDRKQVHSCWILSALWVYSCSFFQSKEKCMTKMFPSQTSSPWTKASVTIKAQRASGRQFDVP